MTIRHFALILGTILLLDGTAAVAAQESRDAIPELAGAEPVTGSILVDGKLPAPFLDYIITFSPTHSQKVSIFQNGLVTVSTTIDDRRSVKKVLFPKGAIDTYRRVSERRDPRDVAAPATHRNPYETARNHTDLRRAGACGRAHL